MRHTGDEGKGKMTDILCPEAQICARAAVSLPNRFQELSGINFTPGRPQRWSLHLVCALRLYWVTHANIIQRQRSGLQVCIVTNNIVLS